VRVAREPVVPLHRAVVDWKDARGSRSTTTRPERRCRERVRLARGAAGRHDGAVIKVYSYRWVPPIVRGVVRDVRVRWALEEIGLPYENVLIGPAEQKSDEYRAIQPFGQVPALVEDDLTLSESGAIVHYLAQKSEKLMPKEPFAQARVTSWMFAALNSVEPFVQQWQFDVFFAKADAKAAPKSRLLDLVGSRLDALVPKLEGREYLEDRFTAADILMGSVMRMLFDTEFITSRPVLLEYRKRCEARPAFKKALADHMASFDDSLGAKEMPKSS
jgi:glutathione S-transferase